MRQRTDEAFVCFHVAVLRPTLVRVYPYPSVHMFLATVEPRLLDGDGCDSIASLA